MLIKSLTYLILANTTDLFFHEASLLYDGEEGLIITNFSTSLDVLGFVLIAKTSEHLQILLNKIK